MKTIKFILWFILHSNNQVHIIKTYYTDLKYYEYKVYKCYYICCLIPIWIKIDNFNSINDNKKYSYYVMNSNIITENLIYK
jgi:hypothetical protein